MPRDPALAASLLVLGLVACTAAPARLGPDADPRAARRLLEEAASAGPVRLELNRPPSTSDGAMTVAQVAEQAARGVRGLEARFAEQAESTDLARLLLLFDPPPGGLQPRLACGAEALPPPVPEGPLRLQAVFCDGGAAVADATAVAEGRTRADAERLIWRTTGRLFPDDYPETYGFDLFGRRVGVGVGGTFGY
ncbi:MAG TPA: hypothetical protein VFY87_11110 [Geminicoccaceae bacterium]|nr:hypothetical protein [Geminicoccaceae bacterium]